MLRIVEIVMIVRSIILLFWLVNYSVGLVMCLLFVCFSLVCV